VLRALAGVLFQKSHLAADTIVQRAQRVFELHGVLTVGEGILRLGSIAGICCRLRNYDVPIFVISIMISVSVRGSGGLRRGSIAFFRIGEAVELEAFLGRRPEEVIDGITD